MIVKLKHSDARESLLTLRKIGFSVQQAPEENLVHIIVPYVDKIVQDHLAFKIWVGNKSFNTSSDSLLWVM